MATDDQLIDLLTNAVNARVDVPWVPESVEATLIRPVVSGAVAAMDDRLKHYLTDAKNGLDAGERKLHEANLFAFVMDELSSIVPVWFRPWVEDQLRGWVQPILQVVFDYTEKGLAVPSEGQGR